LHKPPALARSGALFCRKIKLKKLPDTKTAGGCGVVPFLSAMYLFCQRVTAPTQRSEINHLKVVRLLVVNRHG